MAWPTDDLQNDHLDQGTDRPDLGRPQLNSLVLKIKSILAEVAAGATVWHSGNDGPGSGLDADTVDGDSAANLKSRANHTGTQTMSTISDAGALATRSTINNGYWSGTDLSVPNGGTGASLLTDHYVLVGSGTNAITPVSPGTAGNVLTSNGLNSDPSFQPVSGGSFVISASIMVYNTADSTAGFSKFRIPRAATLTNLFLQKENNQPDNVIWDIRDTGVAMSAQSGTNWDTGDKNYSPARSFGAGDTLEARFLSGYTASSPFDIRFVRLTAYFTY